MQVEVTTQTRQRPGGGQRAAAVAMVVAGALAASGCVTVHGEDALLPAIGGKHEAAKVLDGYTAQSNRVNRRLDAALNARIETGVLGAIDRATLKVQRADKPGGNPGYKPLRLSDTRFLIPRQRGWPKWFVADTANNRDDDRWLLAFSRGSAQESWKASYLTVLTRDAMPEFAVDEDGHAESVSLTDPGLAVPPADLSARYTGYLDDGKPKVFADGPYTSKLRDDRAATTKTTGFATQYADQAASNQQFPPFALRTADGGALVLFTSRHSSKVTSLGNAAPPASDSYTKTLISGKARKAVTRESLAEQVALVPKGSGKVDIADRIPGIVAAHGE